ncbi:unnamed protein product [Ectocarpus sp. 8 AP-2014]
MSVRRSERPGPSLCSERGRSCSKVAECTCLLKAKQTTSSEQQCIEPFENNLTLSDRHNHSHSPVFKDYLRANHFPRVLLPLLCALPSPPFPSIYSSLSLMTGARAHHSISKFPHPTLLS